jgi:hypothetical protein
MLGVIILIIWIILMVKIYKALWGLAKFTYNAIGFTNDILAGRMPRAWKK